jgi:hypothetical protein
LGLYRYTEFQSTPTSPLKLESLYCIAKDAEEEKGTGTNIMEFRAPASEKDPNTPLIPQDYSIFKHVSETYGRLHKEKRVGT